MINLIALIAQLISLITCRRFCPFCFLFVFNFDMVSLHLNQYIFTYLLTYLLCFILLYFSSAVLETDNSCLHVVIDLFSKYSLVFFPLTFSCQLQSFSWQCCLFFSPIFARVQEPAFVRSVRSLVEILVKIEYSYAALHVVGLRREHEGRGAVVPVTLIPMSQTLD